MIKKRLTLEHTASLCGVSARMARKWIDKHGLKARSDDTDGLMVSPADLIDFLIKYNMSIPDAIVPENTRKVLFIYREGAEDKSYLSSLIGFIRQLKKKETSIIADQVSYGPDMLMKIMIFKPDIIFLDAVANLEDVIAVSRFVKSSREFGTIRIVAYGGTDRDREFPDLLRSEGVDEIIIRTEPAGRTAEKPQASAATIVAGNRRVNR